MRRGQRFPSLILSSLLITALVQPFSSTPAQAAITTAACRDTFGTPGNVAVSVTGNDCVIKFLGSSTWGIPTGVTSIRFLLVGGGAAGFGDGGGGGGGGGGLTLSGLTVSAGATANIVVGSGGNGDSVTNGGDSKLDTNNDGTFDWVAGGGLIGGGWTTRVGGSAGTAAAQGSATSLTGGRGGAGPASTSAGSAAQENGSNGFQSDITGTTYYYGGGGGGGIGSHSQNSYNTGNIGYASGGYGGGGAGSAQRVRNTSVSFTYLGIDGTSVSQTAYCDGNVSYPGTTVGFNGRDGFGGGGGGGSAYGDGCGNNTNYDGERNRGGFGGNGVVIIRYTPDVTSPVITGPGSSTGATSAISIPENSTSVFTFSANETVSWSKSGADGALFTLTGAALTISLRDFETPQSSLSSNTYVVVITATDVSTNTTSQTVSVTITNVNEAPVITANSSGSTASLSYPENSTTLYTVTATDVDAGTTLSYSLTGTDAGDFTISASGLLAFNPAADFENPLDSDANNIYSVITWVSDGALTDSQTVTITVTNVNESGSISAPSISGTPYKGVSTAITVNLNAAGKVRFLVNGKRIANCLAISTSGSGSSYTASCNWKPTLNGRQYLTATFTPTSGTFSAATSASQMVWVLKRTTTR